MADIIVLDTTWGRNDACCYAQAALLRTQRLTARSGGRCCSAGYGTPPAWTSPTLSTWRNWPSILVG